MEPDTLEDVVVVDFTRLLPGPFCTLLLSDLGAEVIKVESPEQGDYARYFPPMLGESSHGALFESLNRGKRSIAIDLKRDGADEPIWALLEKADVVIESFRPGVMESLGLGSKRLRDRYEQLIYCSISAYGKTGPETDRPAHDLNVMARAGLLAENTDEAGSPVVPGFQLGDIAGGGLYAALGIVSALYRRARTEEGQVLDISMTEGTLSFLLPRVAAIDAADDQFSSLLDGGRPAYRIYETGDDEFLAVANLEPKFWARFVELMGVPELAEDGLASGTDAVEAVEKLEERFQSKSAEYWESLFEAEEVCVERVQSPTETLRDSLFEKRDLFFELAGAKHLKTPVTPNDVPEAGAPSLGEDSHSVLEELGFDEERVDRLEEEGVI
jgi:crotonobetainyl-CoA:carnitine CoA-transferase CaiB-like acyl-CoA transferase